MGEATRAAISAAAPEVPLDADSGSEEEGEEDDVDDDDDEDAAEDDGDWDVALRGLRLPVGTRVFVDEGTKGGVIGRRAVPFFAVVSSHRSGCRYGVTPFTARQHERAVPAYALSKSSSFLADTAQRSRGQMTSQQKKAKVQGERDRVALAQELARVKKESATLLKKHHLTLRENAVLAAEREALSRVADSKGVAKGSTLMDRVIKSVRQEMASKEELYEKESRRLKRNVSHREKMIDKLGERLKNSIEEVAKLRDRKNAALREVNNVSAKNLLLRDERDAAVAKRKAVVELLEELKDEREQLIEESEAGAEEWAKTRTSGKGRPYSDEFEAHAVRCMATGISAKQCREQMLLNKEVMITSGEAAREAFEVPEIEWFQRLRERVGTESLLFGFVKIACTSSPRPGRVRA